MGRPSAGGTPAADRELLQTLVNISTRSDYTDSRMQPLGKRSERSKDLRRHIRRRRDGEVIVDGSRLVNDLCAGAYRSGSSILQRAWPGRRQSKTGLLRHLMPSFSTTPCWRRVHRHAAHRVFSPSSTNPALCRGKAAEASACGSTGSRTRQPRRHHPGCCRPRRAVLRVARRVRILMAPPQCAVRRGPFSGSGLDGREPFRGGRRRGGKAVRCRRQASAGSLSIVGGRPARCCCCSSGGSGVVVEALASADNTVSIELSRDIESLNVSVAAGVCWRALDIANKTRLLKRAATGLKRRSIRNISDILFSGLDLRLSRTQFR